MSLFKFQWVDGRRKSGYQKMKIFWSERFRFDLYLLRFNPGSYISSHVDPVVDGRHYRLNIYLKKAKIGGEFRHGQVIFKNRFMTFFRPDVSFHSVTEVVEGTRYVLSRWIS